MVYIHVPFCKRKCAYCDFYSLAGVERYADAYVDALVREYHRRREEIPLCNDTLYIGGGTPSLLPISSLEKIMQSVYHPDMEEITIEVNPDDVNADKCMAWRDMGVNRMSMGVQSFNDEELQFLGRRHDRRGALEAYEILSRYFDNVSIDLMFALPNQTIDSWHETLKTAGALSPQHISAYSLIYEEGTAMHKMLKSGKITEAEDELYIKMLEMLMDSLDARGYEHYEISNFAKPGFLSKHNSNYWEHKPYLGLGPGAHSYDGKYLRSSNACDLRGYISGNLDREFDRMTPNELLEEIVMLGMRTRKGIDLKAIEQRFGKAEREKLENKSRRHISMGNMKNGGEHLQLTHRGIPISDGIISDLIIE